MELQRCNRQARDRIALGSELQLMGCMAEVTINQGTTLIYRVFDLGEEIDLAAAETILANQAYRTRLKMAKPAGQALIIRNPPIRINMGEVYLPLNGEVLVAEVVATIWEYGVISFAFQLPIAKGTTWRALIELSDLLQSDIQTSSQIDEIGRVRSKEITALLGSSLKKPNPNPIFDDYIIYFIQDAAGVKTGADLIANADVPSLILGESREPLSERARKSILDFQYQYSDNDLAVIDWNSALILEPSGQREIADILEFALTHLLEFRFYDELLDDRTRELYTAVEQRRQGLLKNFFSSSSREANTRFLEFSEFIERVDNSLKVVGDFYLAEIFRAAVRRFRISDWQQSATRKLNLLARVSELLQGELNVLRGHLLEAVVILLIAIEIFSAVLRSRT
jgi:hypothetical protein